jgi:catechol-2,3-dioxygenase
VLRGEAHEQPERGLLALVSLPYSMHSRPKLDHCVIHVSDWDRSNAFYRDVLGADLIDRGDGT